MDEGEVEIEVEPEVEPEEEPETSNPLAPQDMENGLRDEPEQVEIEEVQTQPIPPGMAASEQVQLTIPDFEIRLSSVVYDTAQLLDLALQARNLCINNLTRKKEAPYAG